MNICVFGGASPKLDPVYINAAERLGILLATRGHDLVFGAGSRGMMGAVARGAKTGGANVIGIIPKFFLNRGVEPVFPECDELILTEDMSERKDLMQERADAFIITPGGIGTFEEMFQMIVQKQLGEHDKPIAIYNVNNFFNGVNENLRFGEHESFLRENTLLLCQAFNPGEEEEMMKYIENDNSSDIVGIEGVEYS